MDKHDAMQHEEHEMQGMKRENHQGMDSMSGGGDGGAHRTAALGVWLMIAPDVFKTQGLAADSDHILGALVVTVAIVAVVEVTRAARFINIALAFAILVLPWVFSGATLASGINNLIIGLLIIALSISPGKIKNTYDDWNALIV